MPIKCPSLEILPYEYLAWACICLDLSLHGVDHNTVLAVTTTVDI